MEGDQTPTPAEDPNRLIRFIERSRRLSPGQKRSLALLWAAVGTALVVGSLLLLRVWREGHRATSEPVAQGSAAAGFQL